MYDITLQKEALSPMRLLSFIKSKFTPDEADQFEFHFAGEILKSERIRCLMLIGIFIAAAVWFLCAYRFMPGFMPENAFSPWHEIPFLLWVPIVLLAAALYEFLFFILLGFLVRKNLRLPAGPRLGNALIEVSLPTVLIFFAAQALYAHEALMLPTSYFYFIFIALSTLRLSFALSLYTGAIAATEYIILAFLLTSSETAAGAGILAAPGVHLAKGLLLLLAGAITGFAAHQIRLRVRNSLKTIEDRNRIVGIFGQHVSPAVVNKLLEQKEDMDGEVRFVCMMFLDIRGFTHFAEGKEPGEVIRYLNHLFGFMIDIVNEHHGIINKFLGDGFMAVFGAPLSDGRDVQNAVRASRAILDRLREDINAGNIPETRVGIGLHSGRALTGNVGSPARKEYTIIGDVVNLASRIEQLNKRFGSQILVSEVVWKSVSAECPGCENMGMVEIRGINDPVSIFKLA